MEMLDKSEEQTRWKQEVQKGGMAHPQRLRDMKPNHIHNGRVKKRLVEHTMSNACWRLLYMFSSLAIWG